MENCPTLSQASDLGQCIGSATVVAATEPDASPLRAREVGDRDHVLGAAGQCYQLRQDAVTSHIERKIDTRHDGPDSVRHAFAVGDGLGAQSAESLVAAGTSRADDPRAARHRELYCRRPDAAGRPVDEHDAARGYAELVECAGRGFGRRRDRGRSC